MGATLTTRATPGWLSPRHNALLVIGVLSATFVAVPSEWLLYAAAGLLATAALVYVVHACLNGKTTAILLAWVVVFPLGYYFLSFPHERPIITFDRAVIGMLLVGACFASQRARVEGRLRQAAIAWALFLVAAALSLLKTHAGLNALRVYVEAFILPALLAGYVIVMFPVQRHLRTLHALTATMCLYAAPIGIAELVRGEDLLPLKGAGTYYAGAGLGEFLRVNGPFQSNNSYALIGLISLFFLLFLRRAIGPMPRWQRMLHSLGCLAALVIALLPMFRSVILTLIVVLCLAVWNTRSRTARIGLVTGLAFLLASFWLVNAVLPDIYEERVSSVENVSARWAQQLQNLDMFLRNPVLGVGVGNFPFAVRPETRYSALNPHGVDPLDAPHNNFAAVLVETGITGFSAYLAAQVLLVAAFWRFRNAGSPRLGMCWTFFLYVLLAYGISGMSLTSGHYGDLNLWYLFTLAVMYKCGLHQEQVAAGAS